MLKLDANRGQAVVGLLPAVACKHESWVSTLPKFKQDEAIEGFLNEKVL